MNIEKINFCAVKRTNDNSSKKNMANNTMPQNSYNNFSKEACAALKSINFCSNAETGKFKAQNLIGRAGGNLRTIRKELTESCIDLNRGRISKLDLAKSIINIASQVLNDPSHDYKDEVMEILYNAQRETTEDGDSFFEQYDGDILQKSFSEKIVDRKKVITMTEFLNIPEIPTRISTYIPNKSLTVEVYSWPDVCSTYVYDLTKNGDEGKELISYSEAPIGKKDECNFKLSFKDGRLQSAIFGMKRNKEGITTINKIFNFKDNSTDPSSVISDAKVCEDCSLTAKSYYQFNESGYICYDKAHISQNPNSDTNVNGYDAVVVKKDSQRFKADKINCTDTGYTLEGDVYEFEGNNFIGLTDKVNI